MAQSSSTDTYFNIHIDLIGYLNRIRTVEPKRGRRGESFLACTIAALNGPSNQPSYVYFDAKVTGREAEDLIRRCEQAVEAKMKVLIGARLGDPWIDQFTYREGHEKAGTPGASFKARLLLVKWIKVNGKTEYMRPKPDTAHGDADAPSSEESNSANSASLETPAQAA